MKLIENTEGLDIDIISGELDDNFSDLVFNTKKVVKDCLFVCIKGRNFDTHDAIDEIVKLGAKAVVVEKDIKRDDICVIIQEPHLQDSQQHTLITLQKR